MEQLLHATGQFHPHCANKRSGWKKFQWFVGLPLRQSCGCRARWMSFRSLWIAVAIATVGNITAQTGAGQLHALAHVGWCQPQLRGNFLDWNFPDHVKNERFPQGRWQRGNLQLDLRFRREVQHGLIEFRFSPRLVSPTFQSLRVALTFPPQIDAQVSGQPVKPRFQMQNFPSAGWKAVLRL